MSDNELEILATAICDVGYWTWWVSNLPTIFQLEFNGTQLYFPKDDGTKPSSQVAIQFQNPRSISFLTKNFTEQDSENWFDDLHHDKLSPPTCSYDSFTFTDTQLMTEIIHQATAIHNIHGDAPHDLKFFSAPVKLVFWAGNYGCAVCAESFKILTTNGNVALEQIPQIHSEWWDYWEKYWQLRDTANALPEDYACEVTIPIGK